METGENKNAKINGEVEKGKKKICIRVSKTKKPLFFCPNLAKKYIKQDNDVELCALGMREWLDGLFKQFERSLPAVAFEDSQKVQDAIRLQEQHNTSLKKQIEDLTSHLARGENELFRLNAKYKEIDEARASLDVDFRI
ncbi:Alba-like domain superfamily [Sesbania bispinosa]|nr:Alba-like domain superfamily [Sesbania bispinosa]